jgi:hypothetical protein
VPSGAVPSDTRIRRKKRGHAEQKRGLWGILGSIFGMMNPSAHISRPSWPSTEIFMVSPRMPDCNSPPSLNKSCTRALRRRRLTRDAASRSLAVTSSPRQHASTQRCGDGSVSLHLSRLTQPSISLRRKLTLRRQLLKKFRLHPAPALPHTISITALDPTTSRTLRLGRSRLAILARKG